jgi:hypothetical protein
LPDRESGIFLPKGLDDPNHLERIVINRLRAHRIFGSGSGASITLISMFATSNWQVRGEPES